MKIDTIEQLVPDEPATVLWCGKEFTFDELWARRDFARLDEAVRFESTQLPLGVRCTAWMISASVLIPPHGVAALADSLLS